jgi:hypothetical protein
MMPANNMAVASAIPKRPSARCRARIRAFITCACTTKRTVQAKKSRPWRCTIGAALKVPAATGAQ